MGVINSWCNTEGEPGYRYTAYEVARGLGVSLPTVTRWIKRGWLKASQSRDGTYRIRHRAVRRAVRDYVTVARTITAAELRAAERKRRKEENVADEPWEWERATDTHEGTSPLPRPAPGQNTLAHHR